MLGWNTVMRKLFEKAKTSFPLILHRDDKPFHRFNELSSLSKVHRIRSHPYYQREMFRSKVILGARLCESKEGRYV